MTQRFEEFEDAQHIIEDISENSLSAISTFFGRLNYLASLRDASASRYQHYGLEEVHGESATQFGLAFCHQELLFRLLEMPLEEQEQDLREFLAGLDEAPGDVVAHWREVEPYRSWLPAGVKACLSRLFLSNVSILLELFAHDYGLMPQAA